MEEKLGSGNFGEVYRGSWKGTAVALKKEKTQESIDQEALLLRRLNHPHIVRYYGLHLSPENEVYLVMEFMYHGALNGFLQVHQEQLKLHDLLAM